MQKRNLVNRNVESMEMKFINRMTSKLKSQKHPITINYSKAMVYDDSDHEHDRQHRTFLQIAKQYSSLSKSNRLKVGCVIACGDTVVSSGYNKMPPNYMDSCETDNISHPEVIHAEIHAINNMNMVFTCETPVMYCTHAPCLDCAKTISISPVATVCFSDIWENKIEGIKLLVNAGKTVIQYHDECPF